MYAIRSYYDLVQRDLRNVCMVFQQFNLWPHKTVLDNVMTPLRLVMGMSATAASYNFV